MTAPIWSDTSLRRAGWVTWAFHAAVLLLGAAVAVTAPSADDPTALVAEAAYLLLAFTFPTVGILIVHRQPRNRMGWLLLLGVGTAISLLPLLASYATLGLATWPGLLPGAAAVAGVAEGSWVWPMGAVVVFVVLLFPDGRLPSPRWRWLPPLALGAMTTVALCISLGSPTLNEGPVDDMANPLYVEPLGPALRAALPVALPLLVACSVAAALSLVGRFRHSRGIERQQLKWLAEGGVLVATCLVAAMAGQFLTNSFTEDTPPWLGLLWNVVRVSFGLLPVAIAIALLRHRLYDIDRILNRTLVYVMLTAVLVGTYLVSVLLFRLLLAPLVGGSDLAVAGSTLAVAALFRPIRARIQLVVDRHFYRRKYDAARTVEAFSGRLRHEVDLAAVSSDLEVVVRDTVQPTHVSLWLRGRT